MAAAEKPSKKRWAWRVILDLMLLAGILVVGRLLLVPAMHAADVRADIGIVASEAHELYEAFERYFERNRAYPNAYAESAFDRTSLDPLRRRGYYKGFVTTKLLGSRIDAYDSPDDDGLNREFWLEMTLEQDPNIRFLVVRSDDAPMSGGRWLEGVFICRDGFLEPI